MYPGSFYARTSETSVVAKFSIAPPRQGQARRRGDAHIVGYYVRCVRLHKIPRRAVG